jgi:hypothetical protein
VKDAPVPPAAADTKFSYVHRCWSLLERAKKVILATDNDAAGFALSEELARRIGREKCWTVKWPTSRGDNILGHWGGNHPDPQQQVAAGALNAGPVQGQQQQQWQGAAAGAGNEVGVAPWDQLGYGDGSSFAGQMGALNNGFDAHQNNSNGWGGGSSSGSSWSGVSSNGDNNQPQQQQQAGLLQAQSLDVGAGATAASASAVVDQWYRKDANEVLVKDGPQTLRAYVDAALPLPIQGLHTFDAFWPEVRGGGVGGGGMMGQGVRKEQGSEKVKGELGNRGMEGF